MTSERNEDQAVELRNILDNHLDGQTENDGVNQKTEMDILDLPPRREVHTGTGKARLRLSKPLIRFLFVLLLLTIMITLAYYYLGDEMYFL